MVEAEVIKSGYVKVTIEASAEGEKLSHSEEYRTESWATLPASAGDAINGCVVGLFGHEDDVRLVMEKWLEHFPPSQEANFRKRAGDLLPRRPARPGQQAVPGTFLGTRGGG